MTQSNLSKSSSETAETSTIRVLPPPLRAEELTAEHARLIGSSADGVVVGTAIVNQVATSLTKDGKATADTVQAVATLVRGLATGTRSARLVAAE